MGRPAPQFWWDFDGDDCDVIVQSDWPGGEELARFRASRGEETRTAQIDEAESLIGDFMAGRKTPQWRKRQ